MKWKPVTLGVLFTTLIPVILGAVFYQFLSPENKGAVGYSIEYFAYLSFAVGIYIPLKIVKEKRILAVGLVLLTHYAYILYGWDFLRSDESDIQILVDVMTSK